MLLISLFVLVLVLIMVGVPVAIALAGSSAMFILIEGRVPDVVVIHRMINGVDSFPLLAIPFFILAGNLMNTSGITERIFDFAKAIFGWMRGGLGHVKQMKPAADDLRLDPIGTERPVALGLIECKAVLAGVLQDYLGGDDAKDVPLRLLRQCELIVVSDPLCDHCLAHPLPPGVVRRQGQGPALERFEEVLEDLSRRAKREVFFEGVVIKFDQLKNDLILHYLEGFQMIPLKIATPNLSKKEFLPSL
ncbi:hypothetical protein LCGC14_0281210, partial [marine sediment metagenome]